MGNNLDGAMGQLVDDMMAKHFVNSSKRRITVRLICNLSLDLPLTPAQLNDFGVASDDHYRALRAVLDAVESGGLRQVGEELDHAMCNGQALTKLVQKYAPEFKALRFETSWDELHL
jgi:hypothetical protein